MGMMWVEVQAGSHKKAPAIGTSKFVTCLPVGGGSKICQHFKIEHDEFFSLGLQVRGTGLKILEVSCNPNSSGAKAV